ncbi:hypothetical protein FOZ62_011600 [Perkinsus olseni]|uniref:Uncharacterized protein n=1 Tax=Perkinsus olseni TaxID=32597 RepID=A0A7J6TI67_PEROL|nr:hypothetical protein FOZ62_011600 [Perkinsus olseni]
MTEEDPTQTSPAYTQPGIGRILYWSFISWLLPFVASIPFFNDKGELQVEEYTFKNCMVIIGVTCGSRCLLRVCPRARPLPYTRALYLSGCFIGINLLLDTLVLLPLLKARAAVEGSEETFGTYFRKIGMVYLSIIPQALALSDVSQWNDSIRERKES